jgi:glycosyltransferase involved in cell wall biosynthesis
MHIIQIAPYYPPYMGGQEKYVYDLSRELVRMGHRVTVLTSDVPAGGQPEIRNGVSIRRFHCWMRPLRNPILPGLFFSPHIPADADILHTHNIHSFSSNVAACLRTRKKLPLVLTSHGRLVFGSRFADAAVRIYTRTVGKATVRAADRVIALTPSEKERIAADAGIAAGKIEVVPLGIDLDEWDRRRASLSARDRPAAFAGRRVILVATQLIRRKGIQYLIQAMSRVAREQPDVLLAIAGRGVDEADLKKQVAGLGLKQSVLFCGYLDPGQLAAAYQSASLFVLPSLGEGQPPCIMEAWVFSKPVIATRIEGVRDAFAEAAVLVEPADPPALAGAILAVLGDENLARDLGRKGRTLVETFTLERVAASMVEIYANVLREQGAG